MAAIAYPTTGSCPAPRPQLRLVRPPRRGRDIYRRRRFAVLVLLVVIVFAVVGAVTAARAAMGAIGGGPLTSPASPLARVQPVAATSYVVRPGDTLWSIAGAVHPSGDLRPYVDRLAAQLHGHPLQAGQRIALP